LQQICSSPMSAFRAGPANGRRCVAH